MKTTILEERKITETIEKLPGSCFTILDFIQTFKELFPREWKKLEARFGLFGEKRRYTVSIYLANRLYAYSHKPFSLLKPFQKYEKGGKGDYRRATKQERKPFGSPWIGVYRKAASERG